VTVYDLEALGHAPSTLILSACESGLSGVRPGDELMGLASVLLDYRDIPRKPSWLTSQLPGSGWHQWGEAADCYCYKNGKMVQNGSDPVYKKYADAAQSLGLTAGLYFSTPDAGHVQLRSQAGATNVYKWSKIDTIMKARFSEKPSV